VDDLDEANQHRMTVEGSRRLVAQEYADDPDSPVVGAESYHRIEVDGECQRLESAGRVGGRKTAGRVVWWQTDSVRGKDVVTDDPFWTLEPGASGESDISTHVDDVLYDADTR
jgi:hypothetical protein